MQAKGLERDMYCKQRGTHTVEQQQHKKTAIPNLNLNLNLSCMVRISDLNDLNWTCCRGFLPWQPDNSIDQIGSKTHTLLDWYLIKSVSSYPSAWGVQERRDAWHAHGIRSTFPGKAAENVQMCSPFDLALCPRTNPGGKTGWSNMKTYDFYVFMVSELIVNLTCFVDDCSSLSGLPT